jgi:hypothetical protein
MSKLVQKKRKRSRKMMYGKEVGGRVAAQMVTRLDQASMGHGSPKAAQNILNEPVRPLIEALACRTSETIEQACRLLDRSRNIADRMFGPEPEGKTESSAPTPCAAIHDLESRMARLQQILAEVGAQVSRLEVL